VKISKQEEKFDKKSERNEIHWALSKLAKAAQELRWSVGEILEANLAEPRRFGLYFFFPVLVLDGKLKVWRQGVVSDANEVLFEFTSRSTNYDESVFISVITKNRFRDWISQFERDCARLVAKTSQQREELDKQARLLKR
jgi:hypothetical protein